MRVLLIDNKSAHLLRLKDLVRQKLGDVRFRTKDPRAITDEDINWANLVVISGGTGRSIEKNPVTFKLMVGKLSKAEKPTVGICLGAEAIAVYYGSALRDIGVRRVGNVRIHPEEKVNISIPLDKSGRGYMVYEFHKWAIEDVSLPLISLARSKDGVELFKHKTKPIWGLQFHPEVRRLGNSGHLLFEHALKELKLL